MIKAIWGGMCMKNNRFHQVFALFLFNIMIFGCVGQPVEHSVSAEPDSPIVQKESSNEQADVEITNDSEFLDQDTDENQDADASDEIDIDRDEDIVNESDFGGFNFSDDEQEDIWADEDFGLDPLFINGTLTYDSTRGEFKSKYCSLRTSESELFQNRELKVTLNAHAQNSERITLFCNDEETFISKGGLIYDYQICKYSQTGLIDVWVALDGQLCASVPILVYNDATKDDQMCEVITPSRNEKKTGEFSKEYSVSIFIDNIPKSSEIIFNCNEKKFTKRLSDYSASALVSGVYKVSCDFSQDPGYIADTSISVGDIYCGDITN
jgi:hypothetical protein